MDACIQKWCIGGREFSVKDRVEQSNIYVSSRLVLKGKGSPPIESSNSSLTFLARCVTLDIYLIKCHVLNLNTNWRELKDLIPRDLTFFLK